METYVDAARTRRKRRSRPRARLYETATKRIKTYGAGVVYAAVGFAPPAGNHGWLVEYGHRLRGRRGPRSAASKRADRPRRTTPR